MNFGDNELNTIVAVASSGSVGIVKLSGTQALEIAKKITARLAFTPRFAHLSNIYDNTGAILDKALVIYFKAPFSFTGEDVVEFQCHGGETLSRLIVNLCVAYGAVFAKGGEFSYRAVLNKKTTLAQAEAAAMLASAQSERAVKALASALSGKLGEFVDDVREKAIELLAYSETSIDYSDEDLPQTLTVQMLEKTNVLIELLENTVVSSKLRKGLFEGFKIAIIGKPNVGKSSLLNNLLAYDRAIVSNLAGTTRDTVEEWINIGEYRAKIIDTAGIRHSSDAIESLGIKLSMRAFDEANIVLALFDGSNNLDDEDMRILELIKNARYKTVIAVVSKSDLPILLDMSVFAGLEMLQTSKHRNNVALLTVLGQKLKALDCNQSDVLLVGDRQINAVQKTLDFVMQAKQTIHELELFSFHIAEAMQSVGEITAPITTDEMFDKMFSSFCLGK